MRIGNAQVGTQRGIRHALSALAAGAVIGVLVPGSAQAVAGDLPAESTNVAVHAAVTASSVGDAYGRAEALNDGDRNQLAWASTSVEERENRHGWTLDFTFATPQRINEVDVFRGSSDFGDHFDVLVLTDAGWRLVGSWVNNTDTDVARVTFEPQSVTRVMITPGQTYARIGISEVEILAA